MKRMGNVLVTMAMVIGAFGAVGCNKPSEAATQPESTPVIQPGTIAPATPVTPATPVMAPAVKRQPTTVVLSSLPAPPPLRFEEQGQAPSSHHRWMRGYWRYDSSRVNYVWSPGYWEDQSVTAPFAPPPPRFEDRGYAPGIDYSYTPGYWRWTGREYVWVNGHWTLKSDARFYTQPRWEKVNGRWIRKAGDSRADADCDGREKIERRPPRVVVKGEVSVGLPSKRGHG